MLTRIKIIKLRKDLILPEYATEGSSGLDLHSAIDIEIKTFERVLIPCGFSLEMPIDMEAQVRPRSGLALKYGITVLNTPGTIDSDYRGEINVILINMGEGIFKVNKEMRIAQIVFMPIRKVIWEETEILAATKRASSGFGSSGL